jgi:hypothetical protein
LVGTPSGNTSCGNKMDLRVRSTGTTFGGASTGLCLPSITSSLAGQSRLLVGPLALARHTHVHAWSGAPVAVRLEHSLTVCRAVLQCHVMHMLLWPSRGAVLHVGTAFTLAPILAFRTKLQCLGFCCHSSLSCAGKRDAGGALGGDRCGTYSLPLIPVPRPWHSQLHCHAQHAFPALPLAPTSKRPRLPHNSW